MHCDQATTTAFILISHNPASITSQFFWLWIFSIPVYSVNLGAWPYFTTDLKISGVKLESSLMQNLQVAWNQTCPFLNNMPSLQSYVSLKRIDTRIERLWICAVKRPGGSYAQMILFVSFYFNTCLAIPWCCVQEFHSEGRDLPRSFLHGVVADNNFIVCLST